VPDPIDNAPLAPTLDDPVDNINRPETPAVPAFAVWMRRLPLLVAELLPEAIIILPPLAEALVVPADNTNRPPEPLLPLPTVMYTAPPRPDEAVPLPKTINPVFPY